MALPYRPDSGTEEDRPETAEALPVGLDLGILNSAVKRAGSFLLREADKGFPETVHTMRFPRAIGFSGKSEVQRSDLFARAVMARIFVDIGRLAAGRFDFANSFLETARHEANYLAHAKLRDHLGGWSYFPGLPELPPDIDSLAAVIRLFSACAPQHLSLCEYPVQLALQQKSRDGLPATWCISPDDPPPTQAAMKRGVASFWGNSMDIDACAHFFLALAEWDQKRFSSDIALASETISRLQHPDGSWSATWYFGPWFVGYLCLHFLHCARREKKAQEKAYDFFCSLQRVDGGWGDRESTPLDTAIALEALTPTGETCRRAFRRGGELLLAHHADDGSWNPSPWIRMPLNRFGGKVKNFSCWYSSTISSAFCLRALLRI